MARTGSFGGSLNPFGGGSLTGFSQYDIGSNLAELEVYRVEVAWGNGTATDDEYLAALTKARDMTDQNTRARETAQNRLDDATYQIGRSKADAQGLDALIAFDQAALAKMSPANQRYRSVSDSLHAEMAQRRSRDYGVLVDEYNAGKISTQKLVEWVNTTKAGLDSSDPDFHNWQSAADELGRRVQSEQDAQKSQDYQMGRLSGDDFVAYLTQRRDSYDPTSPDYADWQRRVEDATKQVATAKLARQDSEFFAAYEEGKKSDSDYLAYLTQRIDGMEADDPDRVTWEHRLNQAVFSLAEDKLRLEVSEGKAPTSRLVTFYKNYQSTLNPGSAEWRSVQRSLDALKTSTSSSGGSGSGGGGGTGKGTGTPTGTKTMPKVIDTRSTLTDLLTVLKVDITNAGTWKAQEKALALNVTSLGNARQRGDSVWLFQDPRHPGQMIEGRNPDGSPMIGSDGKPVMVPGSSYLPVTDEAFSNLLSLQADVHYQLAGKALANHDAAGYYAQLSQAANIEDRARVVNSQYVAKSMQAYYDAAQKGIDLALKTGDWATAVNLARSVQSRISAELQNTALDDTRRDRLTSLQDRIASNPLLPKIDPVTGQRVGGAIDLDNSVFDANGNAVSVALMPGWHLQLDKTGSSGEGNWGLVYDDRQDGTWEQSHISVHTTYGGRVVTGEVSVRTAPNDQTVYASIPGGSVQMGTASMMISYVDENGDLVKAYSLDGKTWLRSLTGTIPALTLNLDGLSRKVDGQGNAVYTTTVNGKEYTVLTQQQDGSWTPNKEFIAANPSMLQWYGQENIYRFAKTQGFDASTSRRAGARGGSTQAGMDAGDIYEAGGRRADLGAPGQSMQLIYTSPSGSLNLTTSASQWSLASNPFGKTYTHEDSTVGQAQFASQKPAPVVTQAAWSGASGYGNSRSGVGTRVNVDSADSTDTSAPSVPAPNGRDQSLFDLTLPPVPPIKAQLPADTPDPIGGVGLTPPPVIKQPGAVNVDLVPTKTTTTTTRTTTATRTYTPPRTATTVGKTVVSSTSGGVVRNGDVVL